MFDNEKIRWEKQRILGLSLLTIFISFCLIALTDALLGPFWGERRSFPKALLVFFTFLSGFYQLAFVFNLHFLFCALDIFALILCAIFYKRIYNRLKDYIKAIQNEKPLYPLYPFFLYLFILSVCSVPGWNWDGMVYHLPHPFLFLNEGTIFTPHYSDIRLLAWPMGADVLNYLFTRFPGNTFGTGFIQFIFYIGIIIAIYTYAQEIFDWKIATTLAFITASFPVIAYGASTEKNDLHVIFSFLVMWLVYRDFYQSRRKKDLALVFLAYAFGLSCKLSFLIFGSLSLMVFIINEGLNKSFQNFLGEEKISWKILIPFFICFLFISQVHLFIYNLWTYGDIGGDKEFYLAFVNAKKQDISFFLQNFFKYQLSLFDFILPFSVKGIPFVDTLLSSLYNNTIGLWTKDSPWNYHYFPEEMKALFGPFGILLLWGTYATCLKRKVDFLTRGLAMVGLVWMAYCAYYFPWQPATPARYFAPPLIAGLIFFPTIYQNRLFSHHRLVRVICLGILTFCCLFNYGKPLISYDPKAIPWYRYAFTDRGFLYSNKYYLDNRMDIYQRLAQEKKRVYVFAKLSDWTFPYYQYGNKAKVRLGNYEFGKKTWSQINFRDYDLIVCNTAECIQDWDQRQGFKKIWENPTPLDKEPNFIEKKAAFYKPIRGNRD